MGYEKMHLITNKPLIKFGKPPAMPGRPSQFDSYGNMRKSPELCAAQNAQQRRPSMNHTQSVSHTNRNGNASIT